jgi:hypothetical protein
MIDEKEQNRFLTLFSMVEEAKPKVIKWETNDHFDVFIGEHYGYTRLPDNLIHQRTIKFYKKNFRWEFQDRVYNLKNEFSNRHLVQWSLILAPDIKIEDYNTLKTRENRRLKIVFENKIETYQENAWYSPEYGVKVPVKKLTWRVATDKPLDFKWKIEYAETGKRY